MSTGINDNVTTSDSLAVTLSDNATSYTIEYYTEAPVAFETNTSNGKQVVMPVQCGGGSVLPTEGTFMFGCNGIYRFSSEQGIELFGASNFSGNTQAALLTPMRGIGKLHLNNAGWCGKEGQSASVGCGSHAYVLIDANPGKIIYGGK